MSSIDFYPTFCQWAGANIPESMKLDGVDLQATLEGKKLRRDRLFWHYAKLNGEGNKSVMRMGRYKYHEFKNGQVQLYDLHEDLGETVNLIDTMPDKAKQMRKILHHWRKESGGSLAVFDDIGKGT